MNAIPEKYKVLRIIPDLQVGGVQRMMLHTTLRARERGIQTEICCMKRKGELAPEFEAAGIPIHVIPFSSRWDLIALFKLRRLAARGRYAIVHSHMYAANMAANMALYGMRAARIINSYHSHLPTSSPSQNRMMCWTQGIPAAWIAVSKSVAEALLARGIPAAKIQVIYNGALVPAEPPPPPPSGEGEPLRLLWAGRFVKQKRLPRLVEVVQRCKEAGLDVRLTLVGSGPLQQKIATMVQDRGLDYHIDLPGYSSDVKSWLLRSDLFVSASEREGFSNAVLEACAQGRGCVVSDIPPHRELLADTAAGALVGDGVEDWVEVLGRIAQQRARAAEMGAEAWRVARTFSIENSFEKLAELYQSILTQ